MNVAIWIIAVCEIFLVLRGELTRIRLRMIISELSRELKKKEAEKWNANE